MRYELITDTDTEETLLRATDDSGKVWWIPQIEENAMYQDYIQSLNN